MFDNTRVYLNTDDDDNAFMPKSHKNLKLQCKILLHLNQHFKYYSVLYGI